MLKQIVLEEGKNSRWCLNCDTLKHFDCFYKHSGCKYGYMSRCKNCMKKNRRQRYENNREEVLKRQKEYYQENKERIKEYISNWQKENSEHRREYLNKMYDENPSYRIGNCIRARLNFSIDGKYKSESVRRLLGCSYDYLRQYLEDKFEKGMSWENHGEWHIDHIIPQSFFDQTCEYQQSVCWHYSNLQPLWSEDNYSKNDSIPNLFEGVEIDEGLLCRN